jgi:hypothetical protein
MRQSSDMELHGAQMRGRTDITCMCMCATMCVSGQTEHQRAGMCPGQAGTGLVPENGTRSDISRKHMHSLRRTPCEERQAVHAVSTRFLHRMLQHPRWAPSTPQDIHPTPMQSRRHRRDRPSVTRRRSTVFTLSAHLLPVAAPSSSSARCVDTWRAKGVTTGAIPLRQQLAMD